MLLNQKPVPYIFDTETGFQDGICTTIKSAEHIWNDSINFCKSVYTRFPDVIPLDRETSFTSNKFGNITEDLGIELKFSSIEAHNYIGQRKGYHHPLWRIFNINQETHPQLDDNSKFRIEIKSINDTMGCNGLVPSLLVFQTIPSFPVP